MLSHNKEGDEADGYIILGGNEHSVGGWASYEKEIRAFKANHESYYGGRTYIMPHDAIQSLCGQNRLLNEIAAKLAQTMRQAEATLCANGPGASGRCSVLPLAADEIEALAVSPHLQCNTAFLKRIRKIFQTGLELDAPEALKRYEKKTKTLLSSLAKEPVSTGNDEEVRRLEAKCIPCAEALEHLQAQLAVFLEKANHRLLN